LACLACMSHGRRVASGFNPASAVSNVVHPKISPHATQRPLMQAKDTKLRPRTASSVMKVKAKGAVVQDEWQEHTDPASGYKFYVNPRTGETSWTKPSASTPDAAATSSPRAVEWTEHVDPASGKTFYYHAGSGQTSWTKPEPSPAGYSAPANDWTEHIDPASGNKFYYNAKTQETSWTLPKVAKRETSRTLPEVAKTTTANADDERQEQEFISDDLQETFNEAGYLLMRLAVASVMIHHGQEKILSAEMFTKFAIDKFFAFLPGPHIYWTYLVGYIQYLAPFFMGLGIFSRAAAASLAGVMTGALAQSVIQNGWEKFPMFELAGLNQKLKYGVPIFHNYGWEVPLLYVAIFSFVAVNGPGKFSIAQLLGWNDDKSLLGKIKQ